MYDYARTNPGSLGSKDMVCANIIGKNALTGFPGNPTNVFLNAQVPFNLFGGKHGVGLSIFRETIGFYSDIDIKLGYAFRFKVGEGTLGIGVNGGVRQNSIDGEWVGTTTIDPATDPNIPPANKTNLLAANVGAGLFYRSEDTYFGASVLNIYSQEFDYADANGTTGTSTAKVTLRPHYFVTAGYNVQLNNPAFELQPSVNFLYDGATVTFDINGTLSYNKKIWGGVSYRAGSAVIGMIGLMILDGAKVGYAYDYQTSALSKYSNGSHEILVNYCFKLGVEKTPQRYKSIRYL
jgi:type IX secretion system PorP/SprF family membrane protein